jgi:tetratricopeptide (TPR) repeat protein
VCSTQELSEDEKPGRARTESLAAADSSPSLSSGPSPSAATVIVGRVIDSQPDAEHAPEPEPGARFGRYVILERLGQGGMGVVYGAYDSDLDRKVAIKILRTRGRLAEGVTEGRARLLREAKAMAKLQHPHVVAVHDVGTLGGRVFVAMEYVDGMTLTRWLKRQPRSWEEVRDVFVQAGEGLAAAHAAGLVHRDFKPDNVLVGKDGRVRVTDFGLARASETTDYEPLASDSDSGRVEVSRAPAGGRDELTQPGLLMGTPPYMAPEHGLAVPVDHRMDQFSFCVALFEALYKRRPFRGRSRTDLKKAMEAGEIREVPRTSSVPKWLHSVVVRGLSARPTDRWKTMDELVVALRRRPWLRRRAVLGAGLGAGLAIGGLAFGLDNDERCSGADQHLSGVWDGARRGEAREGLLASGRSHAEDSWARVERSIDRYADDWTAMRKQACEATAEGEQSAELLDLRMACLDRRLGELDALVDVLAHADAQTADGATWAAATLPPIGHCERADVLAAELQPHEDPSVAAALEDLRIELARAGMRARSGDPEGVLPEVEASVDKARSLGDAPMTASALHLLGVVQNTMGDSDKARDSLSEAALMAAAGEHHRVAAAAATAMMGVVGPGDYKQGLLWGWYAEAAVERIGMGGPEEAAMLEGLGSVFAAHGKLDEARDHYDRAVQLRSRVQGDAHPSVAKTLVARGDILLEQGDLSGATASYERALDVTRVAYGASHPELIAVLERIATAAEKSGNEDLAARHRESLRQLQHTVGAAERHAVHSAP